MEERWDGKSSWSSWSSWSYQSGTVPVRYGYSTGGMKLRWMDGVEMDGNDNLTCNFFLKIFVIDTSSLNDEVPPKSPAWSCMIIHGTNGRHWDTFEFLKLMFAPLLHTSEFQDSRLNIQDSRLIISDLSTASEMITRYWKGLTLVLASSWWKFAAFTVDTGESLGPETCRNLPKPSENNTGYRRVTVESLSSTVECRVPGESGSGRVIMKWVWSRVNLSWGNLIIPRSVTDSWR